MKVRHRTDNLPQKTNVKKQFCFFINDVDLSVSSVVAKFADNMGATRGCFEIK